jgi:3-oxoacyl-[acyl-carrier protein] reductase
MGTLSGQAALVTGGSRGIGRAVALELARHGASVLVNWVRAGDAAEQTVASIAAEGGRALAHQADVSDAAAVRGLVGRALTEFGRLDVLVCNAGLVRSRLAATLSADDWHAMHAVGLWGAFACVQEALPQMITQRRGSIVCLSSVAAERGARGLSGYAAVKGGLLAMVRSLATELGPKGVRVNAVAPGVIRTDMSRELVHLSGDDLLRHVPQRRLGEPDEVARAVRFLASDEASYITGAVLRVDGGLGA